MPPVPRSGRERTEEILRRRALLPPDLVHDPAYAMNSVLWDRWFELEHDHRRRLAFAATAPQDYQGPAEDEFPALVGLEPDEDSDLDWESEGDDVEPEPQPPVKMEVEAAHGGAQPQPPVVDDDAALQMGLDASNLEELGQWPDLALALRESAEEAANRARMEEEARAAERARWQVPWSPWPEHGEGQAYVPPPAWPQDPEAPATPPPAAPPAWLYAPPPYIILDSDEDE